MKELSHKEKPLSERYLQHFSQPLDNNKTLQTDTGMGGCSLSFSYFTASSSEVKFKTDSFFGRNI